MSSIELTSALFVFGAPLGIVHSLSNSSFVRIREALRARGGLNFGPLAEYHHERFSAAINKTTCGVFSIDYVWHASCFLRGRE